MSNELFNNILQKVCDEEFAEYEKIEEHKFSIRHRRKMKKLFCEYDKKCASNVPEKQTVRFRRRVTAVVIAAVVLITSCLTVGALTGGFKFTLKSDHTAMFNIDYENAPQTIEYLYYISALPDKYKLTTSDIDIALSAYFYYETNDEHIYYFGQVVKSAYKSYLNTEKYKMEEVVIDNKNGVFIAFESESLLVWDNGDYVLEIYGNFTKEEMLNLAKSVKIKGF